jgi:hypothetical protein
LRGIALARNNWGGLAALSFAMAFSPAVAQEPVGITPWARKVLLCKQHDGASVLQVIVGLTYRNIGVQPLVVPRFATTSGYRVDREDGSELLRSEAMPTSNG